MNFLYSKQDESKSSAIALKVIQNEERFRLKGLSLKNFVFTPGFFSYMLLFFCVFIHVILFPGILEAIFPVPGEILFINLFFSAFVVMVPFFFQAHGRIGWIHFWRYFTFFSVLFGFGVLVLYPLPESYSGLVSLGAGVVCQVLIKLPKTNAFLKIQKYRKLGFRPSI